MNKKLYYCFLGITVFTFVSFFITVILWTRFMHHIGGREFLIENWLAPMMWEWFLLNILLYLRWEYCIIMFMIAFHQTFIFASQVLAWILGFHGVGRQEQITTCCKVMVHRRCYL